MSETQTELSLVEKAQIINAFWNAPDDATFPPDVTAVVIDSTPGSLTTVRYWESGHMPVPADVAQQVQTTEESIEHAVSHAIDQVRKAIKQHGAAPESVSLLRYRTDEELWAFRPDMRGLPATCHAALISRVRRALWAEGAHSVIQFMDPRAYHDWLAGREDTEALRSAWAASMPG